MIAVDWGTSSLRVYRLDSSGRILQSKTSDRGILNVAPGERWDVLVKGTNPGTWAFHCHILPHAESEHGMFGMVTALVVQKAGVA